MPEWKSWVQSAELRTNSIIKIRLAGNALFGSIEKYKTEHGEKNNFRRTGPKDYARRDMLNFKETADIFSPSAAV